MTRQRKQAIISAVCAAVAVLGVFAYTASVNSEAAMARAAAIHSYGGERVEVVVATKDITVGSPVDESNATTQEWLVDLLAQGEAATSVDQVAGKVAQADIKKNEPIMLDRVGSGASRIAVPVGLSAVSVSSDDVLAVGGAIQKGSFVDVYVETAEGEVVLLGQKILVLETSTSENPNTKQQVTWVTLAVTPASVSELITASSKGTIHFVLPSGTDNAKGGN